MRYRQSENGSQNFTNFDPQTKYRTGVFIHLYSLFLVASYQKRANNYIERQTDRQTDRERDRQTQCLTVTSAITRTILGATATYW